MATTTPTLTASLVVKLVAKDDTAEEVGEFLAGAVQLANDESGTIVWFALRTDQTTFWIVDAFASEGECQAHLDGPIAAALMDNERLVAGGEEVERLRRHPGGDDGHVADAVSLDDAHPGAIAVPEVGELHALAPFTRGRGPCRG